MRASVQGDSLELPTESEAHTPDFTLPLTSTFTSTSTLTLTLFNFIMFIVYCHVYCQAYTLAVKEEEGNLIVNIVADTFFGARQASIHTNSTHPNERP